MPRVLAEHELLLTFPVERSGSSRLASADQQSTDVRLFPVSYLQPEPCESPELAAHFG